MEQSSHPSKIYMLITPYSNVDTREIDIMMIRQTNDGYEDEFKQLELHGGQKQ